MFNRGRLLIVCSAVMLALSSALPAAAQQGQATAPVPAQIGSARRVFISNVGEGCSPFGQTAFSGGAGRPYNQFYAAMKTWGRYELAPSPEDADLDFEINLACPAAGENVVKGGSTGPTYDPQLRLLILDVRTHIVLWGIAEHVEVAILQGNRDKNFDRALAQLVTDLKQLTVGQPAPAGSGTSGP